MAGVSLHVVGRLIEVSDPWDVILPGEADHVPGVRDDDGRVPDDVTGVAFKDRRHDHHVVFASELNVKMLL